MEERTNSSGVVVRMVVLMVLSAAVLWTVSRLVGVDVSYVACTLPAWAIFGFTLRWVGRDDR